MESTAGEESSNNEDEDPEYRPPARKARAIQKEVGDKGDSPVRARSSRRSASNNEGSTLEKRTSKKTKKSTAKGKDKADKDAGHLVQLERSMSTLDVQSQMDMQAEDEVDDGQLSLYFLGTRFRSDLKNSDQANRTPPS